MYRLNVCSLQYVYVGDVAQKLLKLHGAWGKAGYQKCLQNCAGTPLGTGMQRVYIDAALPFGLRSVPKMSMP